MDRKSNVMKKAAAVAALMFVVGSAGAVVYGAMEAENQGKSGYSEIDYENITTLDEFLNAVMYATPDTTIHVNNNLGALSLTREEFKGLSRVVIDCNGCTVVTNGALFTEIGTDVTFKNVTVKTDGVITIEKNENNSSPDLDNKAAVICYKNKGTIEYVALEKINLESKIARTGVKEATGLICATNEGLISRCYIDSECSVASCSDNLGAVCGYNKGKVELCSVAAKVESKQYTYERKVGIFSYTVIEKETPYNTGGICGGSTGTITNCLSTGNVVCPSEALSNQNKYYVGGICGKLGNSEVNSSTNKAVLSYCISYDEVSKNKSELQTYGHGSSNDKTHGSGYEIDVNHMYILNPHDNARPDKEKYTESHFKNGRVLGLINDQPDSPWVQHVDVDLHPMLNIVPAKVNEDGFSFNAPEVIQGFEYDADSHSIFESETVGDVTKYKAGSCSCGKLKYAIVGSADEEPGAWFEFNELNHYRKDAGTYYLKYYVEYDDINSFYRPISGTLPVTVSKASTTIDVSNKSEIENYAAEYGSEIEIKAVLKRTDDKKDTALNGQLEYKSSDESVAEVDEKGKVKINKADAVVTITISSKEIDNYEKATDETVVIKTSARDEHLNFEDNEKNKLYAEVTYIPTGLEEAAKKAVIDKCIEKYGELNRYNFEVKTVAESITSAREEAYKVTVNYEPKSGVTNYKSGSFDAYVKVKKADTIIDVSNKEKVEASEYEYDSIFNLATVLKRKDNIDDSALAGKLEYKSSDEKAVTVDADGKVTVNEAGKTVTITVSSKDVSNYNNASSVTVTVKTVAKDESASIADEMAKENAFAKVEYTPEALEDKAKKAVISKCGKKYGDRYTFKVSGVDEPITSARDKAYKVTVNYEPKSGATNYKSGSFDAYVIVNKADTEIKVSKKEELEASKHEYKSSFNLGAVLKRADDTTDSALAGKLGYISSDEDAVTVDADGNVTVNEAGKTVTITVFSEAVANYNVAKEVTVTLKTCRANIKNDEIKEVITVEPVVYGKTAGVIKSQIESDNGIEILSIDGEALYKLYEMKYDKPYTSTTEGSYPEYDSDTVVDANAEGYDVKIEYLPNGKNQDEYVPVHAQIKVVVNKRHVSVKWPETKEMIYGDSGVQGYTATLEPYAGLKSADMDKETGVLEADKDKVSLKTDVITVEGSKGEKVVALPNAGHYVASVTDISNALTGERSGNYQLDYSEFEYDINEKVIESSEVTDPVVEIKTLTYTAYPQQLLSSDGAVKDESGSAIGSFQYSFDSDFETIVAFEDVVKKEANPDGYTIYYRPVADDNHIFKYGEENKSKFGSVKSFNKSIEKAELNVKWSDEKFVYDGKPHAPVATLTTALGDDKIVPVYITEDGKPFVNPINHNQKSDYVIKVTQENPNYEFANEDELKYSFNIAPKKLDFIPLNETVTFNDSYSFINEINNLSAKKYFAETINNVEVSKYENIEDAVPCGKYTITGTYFPDDIRNSFNYIPGDFTKTLTVTEESEAFFDVSPNELTYSGHPKPLVTVGDSHGIIDGSVMYSVDGGKSWTSEIPEETNAGKYIVFVKAECDSNHKFKNNDDAIKKIEVEIKKASISELSDLKFVTASYGISEAAANNKIAEYVSKNVDERFETEVLSFVTPSDSESLEVDTYPCVIKYNYKNPDDKKNHEDGFFRTGITVNPVITTVEVTPNDREYDGTEQNLVSVSMAENEKSTVEFYLKQGDSFVKCDGIPKASANGTYTVKYVVNPDSNHVAPEYSVVTVTISKSEVPSVPEITEKFTAVYGDRLTDVKNSDNETFKIIETPNGHFEWKDSSESVGDAGAREHTLVYIDNDQNYNPKEIEVTVTVAPKEVDLIWNIEDGHVFEYTGREFNITATADMSDITDADEAGISVEVKGNDGVNSGSYKAEANILFDGKTSENYIISGDSERNYSIKPQSVSDISNIELTVPYGTTLGEIKNLLSEKLSEQPDFSKVNTETVVPFGIKNDDSYILPVLDSDKVYSQVVTYSYKAEDGSSDANYTGAFTETVVVTPVAPVVEVTANEFTYDGTKQPLVNLKNDGASVSFSVTYEDGRTVDYLNGLPYAEEAGTYVVSYEFTPDANHDVKLSDEARKGSVEVVIAKRDVTLIWSQKNEFVFGEPVEITAVPAESDDVSGIVAGDKADITVIADSDVNTGSHKAAASVSNANYNITNPETEYTITKAEPVIPENSGLENEYTLEYGQKTGDIELPENFRWKNENEPAGTVDGDDTDGDGTADGLNKHVVIYTKPEEGTSNYVEKEITVYIKVTPKTVDLIWNIEENHEFAYTGKANTVSAEADLKQVFDEDEKSLVVTTKYDDNVNAGTHTATAEINNNNYAVNADTASRNFIIRKNDTLKPLSVNLEFEYGTTLREMYDTMFTQYYTIFGSFVKEFSVDPETVVITRNGRSYTASELKTYLSKAEELSRSGVIEKINEYGRLFYRDETFDILSSRADLERFRTDLENNKELIVRFAKAGALPTGIQAEKALKYLETYEKVAEAEEYLTDVGEYSVSVDYNHMSNPDSTSASRFFDLSGNYEASSLTLDVKVSPCVIKNIKADIDSRPYDGTTDVTVNGFAFESSKKNNITVEGYLTDGSRFTSPDAGTDTIDTTITLTNGNFCFGFDGNGKPIMKNSFCDVASDGEITKADTVLTVKGEGYIGDKLSSVANVLVPPHIKNFKWNDSDVTIAEGTNSFSSDDNLYTYDVAPEFGKNHNVTVNAEINGILRETVTSLVTEATTTAAETTSETNTTTTAAETTSEANTTTAAETTSEAKTTTAVAVTTSGAQTTTAAAVTTSGAKTTTAAAETTSGAKTTTSAAVTTSGAQTTTAAAVTTSGAQTTTAAAVTTSGAQTTTAAAVTTSGAQTTTAAAVTTSEAKTTTAVTTNKVTETPVTSAGPVNTEATTSAAVTTSEAKTTTAAVTTSEAKTTTSAAVTTSGVKTTTTAAVTTSEVKTTTSALVTSGAVTTAKVTEKTEPSVTTEVTDPEFIGPVTSAPAVTTAPVTSAGPVNTEATSASSDAPEVTLVVSSSEPLQSAETEKTDKTVSETVTTTNKVTVPSVTSAVTEESVTTTAETEITDPEFIGPVTSAPAVTTTAASEEPVNTTASSVTTETEPAVTAAPVTSAGPVNTTASSVTTETEPAVTTAPVTSAGPVNTTASSVTTEIKPAVTTVPATSAGPVKPVTTSDTEATTASVTTSAVITSSDRVTETSKVTSKTEASVTSAVTASDTAASETSADTTVKTDSPVTTSKTETSETTSVNSETTAASETSSAAVTTASQPASDTVQSEVTLPDITVSLPESEPLQSEVTLPDIIVTLPDSSEPLQSEITEPAVTETAPVTLTPEDALELIISSPEKVKQEITDEKLVLSDGAKIEISLEDKMFFQGTPEFDYTVRLSDFNASEEYFDYAVFGFELPEGFTVDPESVRTSLRGNISFTSEAPSISKRTANGGYVFFRGADTSKLSADAELFTVKIRVADTVNAYKNDISVSAVYGRLTGSSEKTADGMVVPHVALADEYTTTASKVLMGLRGDITLDHKVDLIDATIINRELLARETEEPSILPGSIRTNEVSGEDAYKLAEFLGNVSKSEHLTLLDSTYIKRALLYAWTESDGFVTEEIWKMITGK